MESDRIVRFTSGIFQPTVLLQTDVSTTGQDGHTHLTHHRTELLDLRSIEAKVSHEIGKRNLSANLISNNSDGSASIRQRKGQGGHSIATISSCIGGGGNASSYTPNMARKRNTSQDNQRSNSQQQQHHTNVNGHTSSIMGGNSSFLNSSAPAPMINSSSSHISAQKEVIREQNVSTWKAFTSQGIFSIIVKVMTWPYQLYKFWNIIMQKDDLKDTDNDEKLPDDPEESGNVNDSNSDLHENKDSPIPGRNGSSNKTSKKKAKGNSLSNGSKKKMCIGSLPSTKPMQTGTQALDDVETSSTTTDASNDVDIDIGMNTSFSGKTSEIEDLSYDFLPGLSSPNTSNKRANKKKKNLQPTPDKSVEQSKRNAKLNKRDTAPKQSAANVTSDSIVNTNINKDNKRPAKLEENGKPIPLNASVKPCKQQAKVKPNEALLVQNHENVKAGIPSNQNARVAYRNSDASSGGDSTPPPAMPSTPSTPSSFGISTNGPSQSSGIFSSLDPPLQSNNHVLGQKTKKIPPPVGKILPEIKKPENKGAQYGPIGAKPQLPMPPLLASTVGGMSNKRSSTPWNTDMHCNSNIFDNAGKAMVHRQNSSPVHGATNHGMVFNNQPNPLTPASSPMPPPGFTTSRASDGMQTQKTHLSNSLSIGSASPSRRVLPIPNINSNLGLGNNRGEWNNGLGMENSNTLQHENTSSSWMIALQEERRRKTEEYLRRKGGDWPGFGAGPTTGQGFTIDDLWDNPSVASRAENQSLNRLNTFGLSSFENQSLQHNVPSGEPPTTPSSWNTFNEVWPSSPVDPYWSTSSNASARQASPFSDLGGNSDSRGTHMTAITTPSSSEASEMARMMNNPTLSSIWSTPSTSTTDGQQNVASPKNDFSEPPPTSGSIPTSSWPMYQQQNRNS